MFPITVSVQLIVKHLTTKHMTNNPSTEDEIVHTFYLWLCAENTAKAAEVLKNPDEMAYFHQIAEQAKAAFHKKFYNDEEKTYGDYGPNILALWMGVPEERKADVVASLRKEIMETHGGHINTGFVSTKFFFETLSDNGLHDVAMTVMKKTDYPSYGNWIRQGATVTWEQWNGQNSHNHPMFGGGLTWFSRYLAGVNVTKERVIVILRCGLCQPRDWTASIIACSHRKASSVRGF